MEISDASDGPLWEARRKLPSDWEPYGKRIWHGRPEARPDCDTCCWFVELLRTSPDWGACANPESERTGLLTYREQGCWKHEPENEARRHHLRPSRCDFIRRFEAFLRAQAAAYIKQEVRRANGPLPNEEPSVPTAEHIRESSLFVVVRRLLRHADEDFSRPAFHEMAARARKDTRRYWDIARCYWARTVGEDTSAIRLPENMRELENGFWGRVDAAINGALRGREPGRRRSGGGLATKRRRRHAHRLHS
jgi:hypothetical protein